MHLTRISLIPIPISDSHSWFPLPNFQLCMGMSTRCLFIRDTPHITYHCPSNRTFLFPKIPFGDMYIWVSKISHACSQSKSHTRGSHGLHAQPKAPIHSYVALETLIHVDYIAVIPSHPGYIVTDNTLLHSSNSYHHRASETVHMRKPSAT